MVTMAQPIREQSAKVHYKAATVQRDFWGVWDAREDAKAKAGARARTQAAKLRKLAESRAKALNTRMNELIAGQKALVSELHEVPVEQLEPVATEKVANDLHILVCLTDSLVDLTHQAPADIVRVWSKNVTQIADLNRHIDNYAESFRIAADETCSALLADMAVNIMATASKSHGS